MNKIALWLGPITSLVAAGIAGWVSYQTAQLETNTKLRSDTIQNQITRLSVENKKILADKDRSVRKAEIFTKLIDDLIHKDKAGYALLALWQIVETEKEQKVILALALSGNEASRNAVSALVQSGADVQPLLHEIAKKAAERGDEELGQNVQDALFGNKIKPEGEQLVLLKQLLSEERPHYACNDTVDQLIFLTSNNETLKSELTKFIGKKEQHDALLKYILYRAGEETPFLDMIASDHGEGPVLKLLHCAKIEPQHWPIALTYSVNAIRKREELNLSKYEISEAYQAFNAIYLETDNVQPSLTQDISGLLKWSLLDDSEYVWLRYHTLEGLEHWFDDKGLGVMSLALAEQKASGRILFKIEELIETGDSIHEGIKTSLPPSVQNSMPLVRDPSQKWVDWREQYYK